MTTTKDILALRNAVRTLDHAIGDLIDGDNRAARAILRIARRELLAELIETEREE